MVLEVCFIASDVDSDFEDASFKKDSKNGQFLIRSQQGNKKENEATLDCFALCVSCKYKKLLVLILILILSVPCVSNQIPIGFNNQKIWFA